MIAPGIPCAPLRARRATLPGIREPRSSVRWPSVAVRVSSSSSSRAVDHGFAHVPAPRPWRLGGGYSWLPAAGLVCGFRAPRALATHAVLTAAAARARASTTRRRPSGPCRESEARLNRAQRIAKLGSWEWIPHLNCLRWSQEGLRIFGYTDGVTDRTAAVNCGSDPPGRSCRHPSRSSVQSGQGHSLRG